jgi:CubicO group peptidase (beta-lactamase class C family)
VHQPGARWTYSIGDDVLGALVERASGQPFADYVKEHITAPLGMTDTGFDVAKDQRHRLAKLYTSENGALQETEAILGSDPEPGVGFASGGGGMFSTIGDFARLLRAILAGGELDGARILGRKTLELASLDSLEGVDGRPAPGDGWGLFCAVRTDVARSGRLGSRGMLYWSGAATTHFFVDPEEQLIALLFCQHLPYDQHKVIPRFRTAVYQALR